MRAHLLFTNNTQLPWIPKINRSGSSSHKNLAPTCAPYSHHSLTTIRLPQHTYELQLRAPTNETTISLRIEQQHGQVQCMLGEQQQELTPHQSQVFELPQGRFRLRVRLAPASIRKSLLSVALSDDSRSAPLEKPDSPQSTQLHLLTYNIYAIPTRGRRAIDHSIGLLLDSHVTHGYDAILLQELFDRKTQPQIKAALSAEYPYWTEILPPKSFYNGDGGIALASRHPFVKPTQFTHFEAGLYPDHLASKGIVYGAFEKEGVTFHLFGTHAQSDAVPGGGKRARACRKLQFQEFRQWVETLQLPPEDPVLFAGDFNVNRVLGTSPGSEYADLLDIFDAIEPTRHCQGGYTYDSTQNPLAYTKELYDLDYVLYSKHHRQPTRADSYVLPLQPNGRVLPKPLQLSDHFPVYTLLEYDANPQRP